MKNLLLAVQLSIAFNYYADLPANFTEWFEIRQDQNTWINVGVPPSKPDPEGEPYDVTYLVPATPSEDIHSFEVRACNKTAGCGDIEPPAEYGPMMAFVTMTAQPPPTFPVRINSGGLAYVDTNGNSWQADTAFSGGITYSVTNPISGTNDGTLYQTERYGNFSYNIPVPNGIYNVNFHFAELFNTAPKTRVFDVIAENNVLINDLDIFAQVGRFAALSMQHSVEVQDGTLNISFVSVIDNATVVALSVNPLQPVWVEVAPNRYRYAHPSGWLEVELLPNGDVIQRVIPQP